MQLPETFTFTQSNLQDFTDCEFRFLLRHIRHLEWPAIESEPVALNQEKILKGYQFHQLVQKYFAGIDPEILRDTIQDSGVSTWWENFLKQDFLLLPGLMQSEKMLSIPISGYRLSAKYDLLVRNDQGKFWVFDWKTALTLPRRSSLLARLQSKIYPFVICQLERVQNHPPPDIEMIYWFPAFPDSPISFTYSKQDQENDTELIQNLIDLVLIKGEADFIKTDDSRKCAYCRYRSLCDRGFCAGELDIETEILFSDFDYDRIFDSE